MRFRQVGTALSVLALLASCGGGGGGNTGGGSPTPGPIGGTPTPPPPPPPSSTAGCSLVDRQNWVAAQMNEWYLFPETLPTGLSPAGFSTLESYLDALTATARSQGRDRYFTYVTSIAEENAYYSSGSSAGFGFRLSYDTPGRRVFVAETFEGTSALAANIDRGTEIIAIGTSTSNLQLVSDLMASGSQNVTNALGPSDPGVTRVLRVKDLSGATRDVSISKTDYTLTPVSSRYGAKIIDDNGKKVGYVNLRTFIGTADPALRNAFAQFKAQGITQLIVDFRYNGGGLVSIGELVGDLIGGNRSTADVMSYTAFRPSKSQYDEVRNFQPKAESIATTKVAFIGTGGTASASELVINAFIPYLGNNMALVGTNTYGKPVGQIGLDRTACDDRLRVVAFATQNANKQGDYFQGLASKVPQTCLAGDDLTKPLGDPQEASVARALDFLAGRSCTKITGDGARTQSVDRIGSGPQFNLLSPERPNTNQREVPGSF